MWDDFQQLLDYDKDEDLQRMYALLARIPEGLEPLRKKFEEHVKRAGQQAISKLVGEGGANVDSLEPKVYVDALLEVYRKNQHTVQRSFKSEMGFVAALDKACRDFVNRNAATGTSTTKSPELLAKHADALLRKSNKLAEEGELEDALNQVVCQQWCKMVFLSDFMSFRWSCSSTLMTKMSSKHSTRPNFPSVSSTMYLHPTKRKPA